MVTPETQEKFRNVMKGWAESPDSEKIKKLQADWAEVCKGISSVEDVRQLVDAMPEVLKEMVIYWIWQSVKSVKEPPPVPAVKHPGAPSSLL